MKAPAMRLLGVSLALGLVSCTPSASSPTPSHTPSADSMMNDPSSEDPGLTSVISQAKADLASRLSISVEQIVGLEARAIIWPDASLGCPQPGVAYKQVPQDGALVRLSVTDRVYEYHSGGGRAPFLCEHPLPIRPAPG